MHDSLSDYGTAGRIREYVFFRFRLFLTFFLSRRVKKKTLKTLRRSSVLTSQVFTDRVSMGQRLRPRPFPL